MEQSAQIPVSTINVYSYGWDEAQAYEAAISSAEHSCSRCLCAYSPGDCMQDLPLFVDNTFAPLLVSPALWGADVVLTSLTKYFGGGADVIAGAETFCMSLTPLPTRGHGVCLKSAHVTQCSSASVDLMSVRCSLGRGCRRERNHEADSSCRQEHEDVMERLGCCKMNKRSVAAHHKTRGERRWRGAGAVCASRAFIDKLMNDAHGTLMMLGPVMDQGVASDLGRRLPHLGVRVAEHSRRALALAERLQKVHPVSYTQSHCANNMWHSGPEGPDQ